MRDPRVARLARLIVDYSLGLQAGKVLRIDAAPVAAPLATELYRAALAVGAHPYVNVELERLPELMLADASEEQLDYVSPIARAEVELVDAIVTVWAESNTRALSRADPERHQRLIASTQQLAQRRRERLAAGELDWCGVLFPTEGHAQDAEMSLAEYEEFVYRAAFLDDGDPVARWRAFSEEVERVADFLSAKAELRIVADGTDLTLDVGGRTRIPSEGHENFPDGEVFTAPHETSVEGAIRFTYPAVFRGRQVGDVRLRFRGGEVVEATAARGQDFLEEMLAVDEGARRVGEFAFVLNEAISLFTRNTLFDEKIGGTVHLALGRAYAESGGENRSALHWDMICDLRSGGEVYADGELVYRDGRFLAV